MVYKEEKPKILLVEDEPHIAFNLELNLKSEGYDVVHAASGGEAVKCFSTKGPFTMVLLDVVLPDLDGFGVAREIRKSDQEIGILMLTARAAVDDRISGFESGVDDYLLKPFHLQELLLRVKRMVKRAGFKSTEVGRVDSVQTLQEVIRSGPFQLHVSALKLETPRGDVDLTVLEADLLKEFMQHHGKVLSREHLLKKVWGLSGAVETRTVDNFITRLRRYVEEDPAHPRFLISVRGRGYSFHSEGN